MSVKPGKESTNRQKSSMAVDSVREFIEPVADSMVEQFPKMARVVARASIIFICIQMLDWLKRRTDEMVQADADNAKELGDDRLIRDERDDAAAAVYKALVDLRQVLVACFGKQVLPSFGITGDTPRDPVVLARAGAAAVKHLRVFVAEGGRFTFLPAEWVERLNPSVVRLQEAVKAVAQDVRENQLALEKKTNAIEAYDFAFRSVANFLTGLFSAAGRDDLAKRVRPSSRRPGQTAEQAPAAPAGQGSLPEESVESAGSEQEAV